MKSIILSSVVGLMAAIGLMSCKGPAADRSDNALNRDTEKVEAAQAEVAAVETLTTGNIAPHATLPTVIDFNATWCGPCVKFAPIFHEVAEEMKGKALFISVDVDQNREPAVQFGVRSIPQISILYPDGTVRSTVGFMTKEEFLSFLAL